MPFGHIAQGIVRKGASPAENEIRLQRQNHFLGRIALHRQLFSGSSQRIILLLQIIPNGSVQVGHSGDVFIQAKVQHQLRLALVGANYLLRALLEGDLDGIFFIVIGVDRYGVVVSFRSRIGSCGKAEAGSHERQRTDHQSGSKQNGQDFSVFHCVSNLSK